MKSRNKWSQSAGVVISVTAIVVMVVMMFFGGTVGESFHCDDIPPLQEKGLLEVIGKSMVKVPTGFLTRNPGFRGIFEERKSNEAGFQIFKVKTCRDLLEKVAQYAASKTKSASPSGGGGLWGFALESITVVADAANTPIAWILAVIAFLFGVWMLIQTPKNKIAAP